MGRTPFVMRHSTKTPAGRGTGHGTPLFRGYWRKQPGPPPPGTVGNTCCPCGRRATVTGMSPGMGDGGCGAKAEHTANRLGHCLEHPRAKPRQARAGGSLTSVESPVRLLRGVGGEPGHGAAAGGRDEGTGCATQPRLRERRGDRGRQAQGAKRGRDRTGSLWVDAGEPD